ncbi:MAG: thioesterase [Promethearchaeota archaeon CR_4]|nr:MAG: thioesterase [Candidatus Lokiarchaeota archaeon CR_4]
MSQEIPDVKVLEQIATATPPFPQSWVGMSFGSSPRNPHGLLLSFWPWAKGCFSKYIIPDHFCSYQGIAHGSIVTCVLDEVAAWAACYTMLHLVLTHKMEITFLKPVPTKVDLFAISQIMHADAKKILTYSTILNDNGTRLAEATGKFSIASLSMIAKFTSIPEDTLQKSDDQMIASFKEYNASLKNIGKKR